MIKLTEKDHNNHSSVRTIQEVYKETNFKFRFFTTADVQKALENINPKKSGRWDTGITPKLPKNVAKGTAASLKVFITAALGRMNGLIHERGVFKKGDYGYKLPPHYLSRKIEGDSARRVKPQRR